MKGGYNVPDKDIIRRYFRSIDNLQQAIILSDKVKIYDNTFNKHPLIFELEKTIIKNIENLILPEWLKSVIDMQSFKIGEKLIFCKQ